MIVAMGIFILVGASALVLFSRSQTNAYMQQGMVGLNIGLRNATAQLQLDLANAGTAVYANYTLPPWPIGVTVVNNVVTAGTSCYNATTGTYGANCFDQLNILEANPNVVPLLFTDSTGAAGLQNTPATTGGVAYGQAPGPVSLALLQATANNYSVGDQLLFLKSDGSKWTTVVLIQAPTVAYYNGQPVAVQFNFDGTNSDGSNSTGTNFNYGSTTVPNDPLDITACGGVSCPTTWTNFTDSFCGNDWIFKLAPVIYYVNSSNASDPQLIRIKGGTPAVVMDQVIGFKVGATIWNTIHSDITWGTSYYFYDASQYNISNPVNPVTGLASSPDSPFLFSLIRAVRVSLIGRSETSGDPAFTYTNAFDGGRYYVQGVAVIVSPRNLSMND
jgi:hypothetical protein